MGYENITPSYGKREPQVPKGEKHEIRLYRNSQNPGSRKPCRFVRPSGDSLTLRSLPLREAWIEINTSAIAAMICASLPLREAWIEIQVSPQGISQRLVASLAGSVD